MITYPSTIPDNTESELDAYYATCDRLWGFDGSISPDWIDGFLTALAAGPRLPPTPAWIAAMCGDAFDRSHGDPQDQSLGTQSLQARLAVIVRQLDPEALLDDPDAIRLAPLIDEIGDDDRQRMIDNGVPAERAATAQTGAVWSQGFEDAITAFPAIWTLPDDEDAVTTMGVLRDQLGVLREADGSPAWNEHLGKYWPGHRPTRDELIDEALHAVQEVRLFWVDHAPRTETRRVGPTPGRNDPCPCGSGRKFKKCHGV